MLCTYDFLSVIAHAKRILNMQSNIYSLIVYKTRKTKEKPIFSRDDDLAPEMFVKDKPVLLASRIPSKT